MKTKWQYFLNVVAFLPLATLNQQFSTAVAQGTAFTYQGRLNVGANPAGGIYDLRFAIYDSSSAGTQQGSMVTNAATSVSNGLFTTTLDFGNQFPGANRWLEIAVRTNGSVSFFTLSPRQALTPAPYAVTAGNVTSGGLAAGAYGSAVTFNNANNSFSGSFSGNGANMTNVNAATLGGLSGSNFWKTAGNTGTVPGANFVGTTDNQPLELRVNGQRGLRLEPVVNGSTMSNDVNVIGGSSVNFVAPGIAGATISGGGAGSYFGAHLTNSTASDFTVIGGGASITIQTNAFYSTIGGGHVNTIQSLAIESTIGGGANNLVQSGANDSTISGGDLNVIQTNSAQSTIGGGYNNTIQPLAAYSCIGGGGLNTIQNGAYDSTIGAGYNNTIEVNAHDSVISGGLDNFVASAASTVAGGQRNSVAGFAAAIGGGEGNLISFGVADATISGGQSNLISFNAYYSTIGGGQKNNIANNDQYAAIGGGGFNSIFANSPNATVSGGWANQGLGEGVTVAGGEQNAAEGTNSAVGGGFSNVANGNGATVSGGEANSVHADYATIGGGADNSVNGFYSTVPGGINNWASGDYSFAAGTGALAVNPACFVWCDGSSYFSSTSSNQFLIQATGGVGIGLNNPSAALHVASASSSPQFQVTQQNSSDFARLRMNVNGYPSWEMDVSPGATPQLQFWNSSERAYLDYNGNFYATSVNSTSDRNAKENFSSINPTEMLDKVTALPITRWNFKTDAATEHIGPMAQDFYSAFNVGTDEKHIATVDEGGVALAAIQGLNQKFEATVKAKDAKIAELEERLARLENLVSANQQN